jgi:hypothetical protein
MTIFPYRLRDCWVFDDARTGLKEEAFVCGASEKIYVRAVELRGHHNVRIVRTLTISIRFSRAKRDRVLALAHNPRGGYPSPAFSW